MVFQICRSFWSGYTIPLYLFRNLRNAWQGQISGPWRNHSASSACPGSQSIHCQSINSSWIVKNTFFGLNAGPGNKFYWAISFLYSSSPLQPDNSQEINWNGKRKSPLVGTFRHCYPCRFPTQHASPCALFFFPSFFTSNTFHHLPTNKALWGYSREPCFAM